MEHLNSLRAADLDACRLTIGAFDGVHRGHQKILRAMEGAPDDDRLPRVVLTFFPHPSVVLHGRRPSFYLTNPGEKADHLASQGVDLVITETFDRNLSQVPAGEFVDRLQDHLGFKGLWVGPDFALGHQRAGNIPFLRERGAAGGFEIHVVDPLRISGEIVSSTRIRETLRSGDVARAARYLGRWFEIPGTVEKGAGRGKELGIPTANLEIWEERAYPRKGVYACFAHVGSEEHRAVTNVGVRPTFEEEGERPVVETHILDFDRDLYGEEIRLQFVERLRDEKRFSGPEELLDQIQMDIQRARVRLKTAAVPTAQS